MYIKHGKVQFSRRDTFALDEALSPIIASGLKKFYEVIQDRENGIMGVPTSVFDKAGADSSSDDPKEFDKAYDYWLTVLQEMIYAFDSKEPDMDNYDFDIQMNKVEGSEERRYTLDVVGEDEHKRYEEDLEAHYERCKKGRELFVEHYLSLWW